MAAQGAPQQVVEFRDPRLGRPKGTRSTPDGLAIVRSSLASMTAEQLAGTRQFLTGGTVTHQSGVNTTHLPTGNRLMVPAAPAQEIVNRYLDETIGVDAPVVAADFVELMRTSSAAHYEATGQPLRRMLYPGALHRKGTEATGTNSVLVYLTPQGLMIAAPAQEPARATGALLSSLHRSASYVLVPTDSRAAAAMQTTCERDERTKDMANTIGVQRHMEISTKLTILNHALARTFWAPDEKQEFKLEYWCNLFGVSNDPEGWRSLMGACMYDQSKSGAETARRFDGYVNEIHNYEDEMAKHLGKSTSVTGALLYEAQTSVTEAWSAIRRVDPLLRPIYLASGEVVLISEAGWRGGHLVARISVPCRIRVGTNILVCFDDGEIADVKFDGLDYKDHLMGSFRPRSSGSGQRNRSRSTNPGAHYQALTRVIEDTGRVFATSAPHLVPGGGGSVYRWTSQRPEEHPTIEPLQMPVDIAIAGAPDA